MARRRNPLGDNLILILALGGGVAYFYTQGEARKLPAEMQAVYDQLRTTVSGLKLPSLQSGQSE